MPRMYYYVPATGITWSEVNDKHIEAKDDIDAIEVIKDLEDVKRVPPTWKIFLEKDGEFLEVNRRAIPRHTQEKKKREKNEEH
jgi:hypothetical protein